MEPGEIVSNEEQREVEKELNQLEASTDSPSYWIFATSLGNDENFVWLNSGKPLFYSNFNDGEPNNAGDSEHCVEIMKLSSGKGYKWNDVPCGWKKKFICQTRSRDCQFPTDGDGNGTING